MTSPSLFACVTTIQPPTPALCRLQERLQELGGRLVVAGDRKGPAAFDLPGCDFLSLEDQTRSGFALADALPVGHYARKNLAYLHAIREGAGCLYETDDDNQPLPAWGPRRVEISGVRVPPPAERGWINVYRYFTSDSAIWPRGFPLERVTEIPPPLQSAPDPRPAPVQQGLANGSPDVDAVWRLTQDRPFAFEAAAPVWLGEGQWCPFNTQSTWWWPEVFPLLYIPSHCSFRMCDIWKSFVAQRCLWSLGAGVAFVAPEVVQERNPHDFLQDFEDELPGYRHNARLIRLLEELTLPFGPAHLAANLRTCYHSLVDAGFFPEDELPLLDAWLADLRAITPSP